MKNQKGFTAIEGLLILVIVSILGGTGWYVLHTENSANSIYDKATNASSTPKNGIVKTAAGIQSINVDFSSNTKSSAKGGSSESQGSIQTTYKSVYEGISLTYPNDWSFTDWDGSDKTSDAVSFSNPSSHTNVSIGVPMDQYGVKLCGERGDSSSKINIHEVTKLNNNSYRQTYLIKYISTVTSGPDMGKDAKFMAVTDWAGDEPKIGEADSCRPEFASKTSTPDNKRYVELDLKTEDYGVDMSYNDFFNSADIKAATNILTSAIYK